MAHGTHDFTDDPRNDRILIWVGGELVPRERAVVSVFDSGFVLGDGVWEGLRIRSGHPAFLERHQRTSRESAPGLDPQAKRSPSRHPAYEHRAGNARGAGAVLQDRHGCARLR